MKRELGDVPCMQYVSLGGKSVNVLLPRTTR